MKQELSCPQTSKKNKKKITDSTEYNIQPFRAYKNHRLNWKQYASEKFSSVRIKIKQNHVRNWKQYPSEKFFSRWIKTRWNLSDLTHRTLMKFNPHSLVTK